MPECTLIATNLRLILGRSAYCSQFPTGPTLMHVAKAMRTLVDLLNTEHGYARIFFGQDGYSYELYAYQPGPIADLFERMGGYESAPEACEAARQQLSVVRPEHSAKRRKAVSPGNPTVRKQAARPAARRRAAGSMGLL